MHGAACRFYQHQHASCQWFWGLCWDHVVSTDLVHWKNLPPAVVPTQPAGLDADGCFSGASAEENVNFYQGLGSRGGQQELVSLSHPGYIMPCGSGAAADVDSAAHRQPC